MSLPAAIAQDRRQMRPSRKFEGHSHQVWGITHLPDGQRIITCSRDGSLRVWNLRTGKLIATWQHGGVHMWAIASSVDGKKLVSGDNWVTLWNIDTGEVIAKWTGHTGTVRSVCWNGGTERVLSGSSDGTARVWDVESGKTVLRVETGLSDVYTAIYSPDTTKIATGGDDDKDLEKFIKIWDANTGKLLANLKGHERRVHCLAWTADERTLASGSMDDSIRMWNTTTWQQIAVLNGHSSTVPSISISPNGRILASASWDYTTQLWNLENGQLIGPPLEHPKHLNCVSFSTNGKLIVTGCDDNNAYSWDISKIVQDPSLLLNSNAGDKSSLNANAARRPGQQHEHPRRLHPGFFDNSLHPSTVGPFASHGHDTPSRPRFLERAQIPFFNWSRRRNDEGIELRGNDPTAVDVPLAHGNFRNYSAREYRMKQKKEKEKARQMKIAKKAKLTPASGMTQQSPGMTQPSTSSKPLTTLSTLPTTSATSLHNTIIPRVGCWAPFICCTSSQDTSGHH